MNHWQLFGIALAASFAATWAAVRFFPRLGLLDNPAKYGLTRAPMPHFGGLAVFFVFVVLSLIFLPWSREVAALLAGATLLGLISFVDDIRGLSPAIRLAAQAAAAGLLTAGGAGIAGISDPFSGGTIDLRAWSQLPIFLLGGEYSLSPLADAFTVLWVIGLVNALNWQDGVPGLAPGVTGLAALILLLLAGREGFHFFDQSAVLSLAAIAGGVAFGFLFWNFPPQRILLGDTGSMLFGFILAALAIFSGGKVATAALVLGVPLLDAVLVICRRILRGQAPWRGDYSHLHHRLLGAGLSRAQAVLAIYAACAAFGLAALLIDSTAGKLIALSILSLAMLAIDQWLLRRGVRLGRDAG